MSARKVLLAWVAFFILTSGVQFAFGALSAIVATTLIARSTQNGGTAISAHSLASTLNILSWVVMAVTSCAFYYWSVRKVALRQGPSSP